MLLDFFVWDNHCEKGSECLPKEVNSGGSAAPRSYV